MKFQSGFGKRLAKHVALEWVPVFGAKILRKDPDAIRRPLLHRIISIEGPAPSVWSGPIFIHIPKAAGTSILATGVQWCRGHQPYRFYERHLPKNIPMPFTFTVVRHPLDRYISAFYYLRAGGITAQDRSWSERNIPRGCDHNSFAEVLAQRPRLLKQMHLKPQVSALLSESGRVGPNEVLRLENLAEEWPRFAAEHGLRRELKCSNAHTQEVPPTTSRCRAIVKSLYREDLSLLEYDI